MSYSSLIRAPRPAIVAQLALDCVLAVDAEQERAPDGKFGSGGGKSAKKKPAAKSHWMYQASEETPSLKAAVEKGAIHKDTTEEQWNQMSPGMRREIVRSKKKADG